MATAVGQVAGAALPTVPVVVVQDWLVLAAMLPELRLEPQALMGDCPEPMEPQQSRKPALVALAGLGQAQAL